MSEETDALFKEGTAALQAGHPAQAIADFEALADRGVVDASASYDRGLAYAMRVRIGGEVAGDLGQAAQGFEEARTLASEPGIASDATVALSVIRTEVARRRARAGEPVEIDPGEPALRAASRLMPEDVWLGLAAFASLVVATGLFVWWRSSARRARIAGVVAASVAVLLVAAGATLGQRARADRLHLREAVVIAPSARPSDEQGVAVTGATPLPEAARVEITSDEKGSFTRVRFGSVETWIPTSTLRPIAKPE
jgi:hypothetical protein